MAQGKVAAFFELRDNLHPSAPTAGVLGTPVACGSKEGASRRCSFGTSETRALIQKRLIEVWAWADAGSLLFGWLPETVRKSWFRGESLRR
jgi:hypothetical protein